MRILYFDAETVSAIELPEVGAYQYVRHPSTDLRCVSYCLVENGARGPIETWAPGQPIPATWIDVAADPGALICAFNIPFDGLVTEHILTPRYGWPAIPRSRWRCAQAAALAKALPGSLDAAATALKLEVRKNKIGTAMMRRLAGPRPQTKKDRKAGKPLDFSATPEEMAILIEYNVIDVTMLMEIVDRIGLLPPAEQTVWQLNEIINARGVHIDVPLLDAALAIVKEAKIDINDRLATLTGGIVTGPQQTKRIIKWLGEHGCKISNVRKGTVADALLEPGLTEPARELLELRQSGAGAAPSKLPTLRRWASEDDHRIRHAYRYHGAAPGRFTSLGCQLHNLKKPEMEDVAGAIAAVASGSLTEVRARGFARPLEMVGQLARALPTPAPGKRFLSADLSGIEARGAAFIVGDRRELEQWRTFDRTDRPEDEPYYLAGLRTFRQPPEKARKSGKVGQLAFQYGGGVGAYRKITGDTTASDEVIEQRKTAWRNDHPLYTQFWKLVVFQATQAIRHPGRAFTAKTVTLQYDSRTGFLELALPSGRKLSYPHAELYEDEQYGSVSFTFLDASRGSAGRMYHELKGGGAWGGLILENICQALCRDVFVEGLLRLEAANYAVVMHSHDDYVVEVPEDFGTLEEFVRLITMPPTWAASLPVAAKGRVADRFIEIPEPARIAAAVTDNIIDNAVEELREEAEEIAATEPAETPEEIGEIEEIAEEIAEAIVEPLPELPVTSPPGPPEAVIHACGQCQGAPDGSERVTAYAGVWLHPQCEGAFIRARMIENGITWEIETPPPESPPAAKGNGHDATSVPYDTNAPGPAPRQPANGQDRDGYPHGEDAGASPIIGEYIYTTADGKMHAKVLRTAAHTFPTFHWKDGAWVSGWPETAIPYKLPELLAAPADAIVLNCEGEKDCETARRYGFVATCNLGGAGKWRPELAQYFKGKQKVCIVEDHDIAGAGHTALILKALAGVVPAIGVLRFPELPEHGDLTMYLDERGGTKPALLIRIEEAFKAPAAELECICAADEEIEALDWMWPGRFALGKIGLLVGLPDEGKGLTLSDMIARVTRGSPWPCGEGSAPLGNALLLTAEDDIADTVVPRLMAAGADLARVTIVKMAREAGKSRMFSLITDLEMLQRKAIEIGGVKLVVIDPITAYLGIGKIDSYRTADVRAVLGPLQELAAGLRLLALGVMHFNKKIDVTNVLLRVSDSLAFGAAARHVYAIVNDPDNNRKLFVKGKNNLAPRDQQTLAFGFADREVGTDKRTGAPIIAPFIAWHPEAVDITAIEAMTAAAESKSPSARDSAKQFLEMLLSNGPVAAKEVHAAAKENGVARNTLRRAKDELKIEVRKDGPIVAEDRTWQWHLPKTVAEATS